MLVNLVGRKKNLWPTGGGGVCRGFFTKPWRIDFQPTMANSIRVVRWIPCRPFQPSETLEFINETYIKCLKKNKKSKNKTRNVKVEMSVIGKFL